MYSIKLPDFSTLNIKIKILRKIASLQGIPYNILKNILIKKLYEKYNEIHNKQNNITIETTGYVNGDRIICINEKCEGTIIIQYYWDDIILLCQFFCHNKKDFNRHLQTKKHKNLCKSEENMKEIPGKKCYIILIN